MGKLGLELGNFVLGMQFSLKHARLTPREAVGISSEGNWGIWKKGEEKIKFA